MNQRHLSMDVLTVAADAILREDAENKIILTPLKNMRRPAFGNLTNQPVLFTPNKDMSSSISSLLNKKITCNSLSLPKPKLRTPGKWRKSSQKFGDENEAPSPKTPKHDEGPETFSFFNSPMTPLSNLKMLTRIASMEEHIPSKKTLFSTDVGSGPSKPKLGLRRCISENMGAYREKEGKTRLKKHPTSSDLGPPVVTQGENKSAAAVPESSRREKSLGLLCERFLEHFPMEVSCLETPRRLVVDDVAASLGTERRRVYDIVNVLESLNMASRIQKNMYHWLGKRHLETTLSRLRGLADEWRLGQYLDRPLGQPKSKTWKATSPPFGDKCEARKEKSIGILCQKFLMLFLVSPPPHVIQLETAIQLLLGQEGDDLERLRSRGRRIYDIANVLVALRLIRKLPQFKSFMYVGPTVESVKEQPRGSELQQLYQGKLRHSLLPPPLLREKHSPPRCVEGGGGPLEATTPSDDRMKEAALVRRGRPRKLPSELFKSKAKRNCLPSERTRSEEERSQSSSSPPPDPPAATSSERGWSAAPPPSQVDENRRRNSTPQRQTAEVESAGSSATVQNYGKQFRGIHPPLGWSAFPRMALTFDDAAALPGRGSAPPSTLSTQPAAPNLTTLRTPFVIRRVSLGGGGPPPSDGGDGRKLVIVRGVKKGPIAPAVASSGAGPGPTTAPEVRVAGRTPSAGSCTALRVYSRGGPRGATTTTTPGRSRSSSEAPRTHGGGPPLPIISLNTLSRSHYKTVLGSRGEIPGRRLSSPTNKGSHHFVISSNTIKPAPGGGSEEENPPSSFVRMLRASSPPGDPPVDTELEGIFGDSFRFMRPRILLGRKSS